MLANPTVRRSLGHTTVSSAGLEATLHTELQVLQSEWRSLHAESELQNPFLSHEWTAACWEELGGGASLFVVAVRERGRLIGLAPLRLERRSGFRVLRFIGDGRSDYLGFLVSPQHPEAARALLEALGALRHRWDLAVLRQLGEPYTDLATVSLPAGVVGRGVEGTVAPYFAHAGNWDSAVAEGPKWLRKMGKESRRFERVGGTVERLTGAAAAAHVPTVAAIEAASWKGRTGVARFRTAAAQALLRQALTGLPDQMELWLACVEGEPVAFEINFLASDRIWLYQGAFREEARRHSPGAVLDFQSIRRAWEAGVREYDFLAGDEEYKMCRTTELRPIRYLALLPACARGHLAYTCLVALRWRLKEYAPARAAFQYLVGGKSRVREALQRWSAHRTPAG